MKDLIGTVSALAATLSERERQLLLSALSPQKARIAIVGMACRFPGGADDPEAFFARLKSGYDAVTEVPAERFDVSAYFDPDPDAPGRMLTRYGAFLDGIDRFDAGCFDISPHEARRMDPQQRLLLETTWDALDDAGLVPERLRGTSAGVFIGACSHDCDDLQPRPADAHTLTGSLLSVLAGRLSHAFGLQGPSVTIDTACSSSLVALHLACASLRSGESSLALVGGVNVILSPEGYVRLSRMRALSADGRCRTFDARASGYARGEGVAILVLKRLSDAQKCSDRIRAVIRGSAINHDGRSSSLTAPNGLSQREVIRRALADAEVLPEQLDYIEAHGTGTPLGDPIEVESLREILAGRRGAPCELGSVKTNIGHLEAAAGVAGIVKTVLALEHEEIPPHLHLSERNPRIDFGGVLTVPVAGRKWARGARERIAGVSSFGISGTNAHVVLAEAPLPPPRATPTAEYVVLPLSAKSPDALAALIARFEELLRKGSEPPAHALAHTAATRRGHHGFRCAVVGKSRAELAQALAAELKRAEPPRSCALEPRPPLVLAFCGEASPALAARLIATEPQFAAAIESAQALLGPEIPLLAELSAGRSEQAAAWAAWAIERGVAALFRAWGLQPGAVLGWGRGEVAAAQHAELFPAAEALRSLARAEGRMPGRTKQATLPLALASLGRKVDGPELDDAPLSTAAATAAQLEAALGALRCEQPIVLCLGSSRTRLVSGCEWLACDSSESVYAALATLYRRGFSIDWESVHPGAQPPVPLPRYPFLRERHWLEQAAEPRRPFLPASGHGLFGEGTEVATAPGLHLFAAELDLRSQPLWADHRVGDAAVLPAAASLDAALWAARELLPADAAALLDVKFEKILPLRPDRATKVQLCVTTGSAAGFDLHGRDADAKSPAWVRHVQGAFGPPTSRPAPLSLHELRTRLPRVELAEFYERLRTLGLAYGPLFSGLSELHAGPGVALGRATLPSGLDATRHVLHPALFDSCLQVMAAAAAGFRMGVPVEVGSVSRFFDADHPPITTLLCHAQVRAESDLLEADLLLVDESGQPLLELTGFRVQRAAAQAQAAASEPAAVVIGSRAALRALITEAAREVLGLAASIRIPPAHNLAELGMDSLLGLDLAARLSRLLGRAVPNSLALEFPSIQEMTGILAEEMGLAEEGTQP